MTSASLPIADSMLHDNPTVSKNTDDCGFEHCYIVLELFKCANQDLHYGHQPVADGSGRHTACMQPTLRPCRSKKLLHRNTFETPPLGLCFNEVSPSHRCFSNHNSHNNLVTYMQNQVRTNIILIYCRYYPH